MLDVACGSGRHLHALAGAGFALTGVDRDRAALAECAAHWPGAAERAPELVESDIESRPWPLGARQFDAVLVFNYLWRPLWPTLLASLAPGGVLLYETFALGQETVGRPARAEFLLQPGELLARCATLRVVGYEDGFADAPERFVQRIAALRETPAAAGAGAPARHRLPP